MAISALRDRVRDALLDFAWDEWGQMGVHSAPRRSSPWAQDPEALLVFTWEVARHDPRLFDEVLDWLVVNEPIVSLRRVKRMCTSPEDARLADAVLGWLAQHRPRSQAPRPISGSPAAAELEPLYYGLGAPISTPDEAFAAAGLLRPLREPSGKAGAPDVRAPINFAFRLRMLLGVGARAEATRFLLTADGDRFTTQAVTRSAGYARRNVQEALTSLGRAGVVDQVVRGSELWYRTEPRSWAALLDQKGRFPRHRDWPQLLSALRELLRWLNNPALSQLSDYLLASEARDLVERIQPDLHYAGLPASIQRRTGDAWDELEALVESALSALQDLAAGHPRQQ
jgi:hypothetical protein